MHPRELSRINDDADSRLVAAAEKLAAKGYLTPELAAGLRVYDRDPETRAAYKRRAVADAFEAVADKVDPATGEDLEALSVPDLKDLAAQRGVELEARLKKADIIAALEAGNPAPPPEPEQQP
jgi:hypothetical protein